MEVKKYSSKEALSQSDKVLLEEAIKSREQAYAPYSRFKVGAALVLEDGTIVKGNNQENAAYPSGLCAERVAIFAASANHRAMARLNAQANRLQLLLSSAF